MGKGGGFADLEFALLVEAGLIGTDTVLVTTVHPLQVLAEALETTHDLPGPDRRRRRGPHLPPHPTTAGGPLGHLDAVKVAAIPALAAGARWRRTLQP